LQLVAAYRAHHADRIVAERNNGGAMVAALCVQARIRLIVWCLPFGEPKRAAAATKTWLLAQIEKKRAPAAPTAKTAPDERFVPAA
jgi:phage terminase large subunit-like protein